MLNHRLLAAPKDPEGFVKAAVDFIKKHATGKKVFCALSGGVDSSAVYLLLKEAGVETLPVFIDHGLMRVIRGKEEREYIQETFPATRVLDIRDEFLPRVFGEGDAEAKRKLFKKAYSSTIDMVIKEETCDLLADGTILPDIEESFGVKISELKETMSVEEEVAIRQAKKGAGFVKSQHNLEIEYAVEATIQPVACLTKPEVRAVLEYFKMPTTWVYRKAFPGPALAARVVGPVSKENLAYEKMVHDLVESSVEGYYIQTHGKPMIINDQGEQEPFQVFAATVGDVTTAKVTGVRDGRRVYDRAKIIEGVWDYTKLTGEASKLVDFARLFYKLGANPSGKFDVVIRSVNSVDARTASVTDLPDSLLKGIASKIQNIPETRGIYVDVTPKPPATIEYV